MFLLHVCQLGSCAIHRDIDLVLLSTRMMKDTKSKILYRLAPLIREQNIGQEVVVIAKAKVPIIKFKTIFGNFQVDISINQANGLVALKKVNELLDDIKYLSLDLQADQRSSQKSRKGKETDQGDSDIDQHEEAINKVVEDLGAAKCMILVIKSVLKQRGMNEVYSGGLGSYSIICLVTSFLQVSLQDTHAYHSGDSDQVFYPSPLSYTQRSSVATSIQTRTWAFYSSSFSSCMGSITTSS